MKILVYDVAAEDGGGLFVLKSFYQEVLLTEKRDIEWLFVVSNRELEPKHNVSVIVREDVKKSWLHRWSFENREMPRLIQAWNPDLVISLQNMPIRRCRRRQFVYLHQSLQFCPYQFSFLKREERGLAIRQRIICEIYKRTLPLAEQIYVQTRWMKEAMEEWISYEENRISVIPVTVDVSQKYKVVDRKWNSRTFFYPARAEIYKNHRVIIEACKLLLKDGVSDFRVIFTVEKEKNAYAEELVKLSEELPIEFVGNLSLEEVYRRYGESVLLFPSFLETCGLPLLEARAVGTMILASDMPFCHEALDDYPNKEFFSYDDALDLAEKMKKCLNMQEIVPVDEGIRLTGEGILEGMMKRI